MACGEVEPSNRAEPRGAMGQRSDAIVNGTVVEPVDSGFALLTSHSGTCTATLHTNLWALTAKHCLDTYDRTYPYTLTLRMGSQVRRPWKLILHPTQDVAIILLSDPFIIAGSDHSFVRPLHPGTAASLNDSLLPVYGYGAYATDESGSGTLRYAQLRAYGYADSPHYLLLATTSGKQLGPGDSGGASIWRDVFSAECPLSHLPGCIAGISTHCTFVDGKPLPSTCTQLPAGYFRTWFYENIQPTNAATFVSQSIPTEVQAGQPFTVSITVRNTGAAAWTQDLAYRLGSQSRQDNTVWGVGRVGLDYFDMISPGSTKTFTFTAVAPDLDYTDTRVFQWRMLRESVEWFGEYTPRSIITVRGRYGDTPPDPEPTPCELNPSMCEQDPCYLRPWTCGPLEPEEQ
ncbi:trypsin-like serine protease [Archangium lansingense]|uniref:trypsin-like serine protease n=1 Tax=Archangium lansingense TaxID=2995310 RepID=UPI003B7D7640